MTIKELLKHSKNKLSSNDRKTLECEILLSYLLQKPRIFLHSNDNFIVPNEIIDAMNNMVDLLNTSYPIEYITNKVSFYSKEFFIKEGVLIPRPETELLIDKACEIIKKFEIKKIYEIGVGSGVISIMLALKNKDINIIATDISPIALEVTMQNIKLNKDPTLESRISLVQTKFLEGVAYDENSLIVSNPPYIKNTYKIDRKLTFEPKEALFGGVNGSEIIEQIITLNPKYLCCEVGYDQEYLVTSLRKYDNVEFYRDYSGFIRGFIAFRF